MNDFQLMQEAVTSYTYTTKPGAPMPTSFSMETHDGDDYVVLRGVSAVLAVYLVRKGKMLRKVPDWRQSTR